MVRSTNLVSLDGRSVAGLPWSSSFIRSLLMLVALGDDPEGVILDRDGVMGAAVVWSSGNSCTNVVMRPLNAL